MNCLVYPPEELRFKRAILSALENHGDAQAGIGYNMLFEKVREKVGHSSRTTFNKYLKKLINLGSVKKEQDPRHKRGVIIYKTKEGEYEKAILELSDRLTRVLSREKIEKVEYEEPGKMTAESEKRVWVVANCIKAAHSALFQMLGLPSEANLYVGVFRRKDGTLTFTLKQPSEEDQERLKI